MTLFSGVFKLAGKVKERRLRFTMRGKKNIWFQHKKPWRALQINLKSWIFDSVLAGLPIQDLEKNIIQFEDQIKEILSGEKSDCWRHKIFLHEACEEYTNQSNFQLINFDKISQWSNKNDFFCETYYGRFFLSSLNYFVSKYINYLKKKCSNIC